MGYVAGGWVILATNNLLAGRGFSPRTAIGAAIAALLVGVMPDPIGYRFGQIYLFLVLVTHGSELLGDIGFDTNTGGFGGVPDTLPGNGNSTSNNHTSTATPDTSHSTTNNHTATIG